MKKALKRIALLMACVVLMGLFYLAVVLGQPQDDGAEPIVAKQNQPKLTALPSAILITDDRDLADILAAFPAPVMHSSYGNALTFEQGLCRDVSYEGGLGRIVTLTYRTETRAALTVTSIYPARALDLMGKGDYTISGMAGQNLAGLRSVRMENEGTIRLHAQGTDALYVVTTDKTDGAVLRQLTASLMLSD